MKKKGIEQVLSTIQVLCLTLKIVLIHEQATLPTQKINIHAQPKGGEKKIGAPEHYTVLYSTRCVMLRQSLKCRITVFVRTERKSGHLLFGSNRYR